MANCKVIVKISDGALEAIEEVKQKKILGCRFLLSQDFTEIMLEEDSKISLEHSQDALERLVSGFHEDECRYAIFDARFIDIEHSHSACSKLVAISWCPNTANPRLKITYTCSTGFLRDALTSHVHVQMCDHEEQGITSILSKVTNKRVYSFQGQSVFEKHGEYNYRKQ